ncbi:hypothetical protein HYZ78_01630 [Candidatus Microgenomates bacterium]|nr:hypothetical protein [Candidatus Microgenomates bacterium]
MFKSPLPTWLLILLIVTFVLRVPSFFEPYWYGDEGITLTLGQGISNGLVLYRDLIDNKPPLLYLIAAVAGNQFWLKAILAFWSLATIVFFWKLISNLFNKEGVVRYATIVFAILITLPLLEGNIANGEIFILLPTILAYLLLFTTAPTVKNVFLAGLILGIGVLFKLPAIFDIGAPIGLWLVLTFAKKFKFSEFLKLTTTFIIAVLTPLGLTVVYYAAVGLLNEYFQLALLANIGYLSTWSATAAEGTFFTRNQDLIIRAGLVIFGFLILNAFFQKGKITKSFFFVSFWFLCSLFAATLSERPYPHYLLQVIPSLSLMLGIALSASGREQFLAYPMFLTLGAVLVIFKFYYYPVFTYYENFIKFAAHQQSQNQFFANFDSRTPRNYEVARFLTQSARPGDKLFIWGDDPELYALSKLTPATPYVAAYHVAYYRKFDEVAQILSTTPPRFIVTTQNLSSFPALITILDQIYVKVTQVDQTRVYLQINSDDNPR